jgi:orotidine-5'-phosphate decarboxylase
MIASPRVIVALDYPDKKSAQTFIQLVTPQLCALKIGKHLFTKLGPEFVREVVQKGFHVFLDLKFHDIPNTVFDACTAAAELGVWMLNVHVSGGVAMMNAARRALDQFPKERRPLLIGVTVLTSLDQEDISFLGLTDPIEAIVLRMAVTAKECGLDGVVCSAQEAALLKKACGKDFILVTPGIRLASHFAEDQKRIMTPEAALLAGADYLVIGRSITATKDPAKELKTIRY